MQNAESVHVGTIPEMPTRSAEDLTIQEEAIRACASEMGLHFSQGVEEPTADDAFLLFLLNSERPYAERLSDTIYKQRVTGSTPTTQTLLPLYRIILSEAKNAYESESRTLH